MADDAAIARIFEQAALAAGRIILDIYRAGPDVRFKGDSTPVTEADEAAENLILADLIAHLPHLPVIAEEAVAAGDVPTTEGERFLLVDPLDGTREFIAGHDDFTVNIALIDQGMPKIGVVYAPALGIAYLGFGDTAEKLIVDDHFQVTSRSVIRGRPIHPKACALVSRSHNSEATEAYIRDNGIPERQTVGSSLKFCLLAEGEADLYPRFGRTMEWDTAAGDAVLRAAGGITLTTDHQPLVYGKRNRIHETDFANPDFIAWASPPPRG